MEEISNETARQQFLELIRQNELEIFTGAGISMISPSKLPSGKVLKELIVRASVEQNELSEALKALESSEKYQNVVPEIIFQDIYASIGNKLFPVFNMLKDSPSNHIHQGIANLLQLGLCNNFTTNFDLLVDNHQENGNNTFHLHGSILNPQKMSMRIYKVGQGVERKLESKFLEKIKHKTLFVFGYSGNDTDIVNLLNKSEVKDIYWMMYNIEDDWTLDNIRRIKKSIFLFEDDLGEFFNVINEDLGFYPKKIKFTPAKDDILKKYRQSLSRYEQFFVLGHLLFRISIFDHAKVVFKRILQAQLFTRDEEYLKSIIFYTDCIRVIGEDVNEGLQLLTDTFESYKKENYPLLLAGLKNMHGLLLLEKRKSEALKASVHFEIAKSIYEDQLDKSNLSRVEIITLLSRTLNNLGLCYDKDPTTKALAIKSYKKSIRYKYQIGNYLGQATSMCNLALVYLNDHNYASFYYWNKKVTLLIDKYKMHYRLSYFLREQGNYYLSINKTSKAKSLLQESLHILHTTTPSAKMDIEIINDLLEQCK